MNNVSNIDRKPFRWAIAVAATIFLAWLGFHLVGEQRYHNTAWWQRWHPITLTSEPQTAQPVEIRDQWRNALTVVQTEKGLYFLSGTKYVPPAGAKVVIAANDYWELYMCMVGNGHCMSIHSFCAGAVWPNLKRDINGRADGCYAPYVGKRSAEDLKKLPLPPEPARGGPGKRFIPTPPPVGVSHPQEWAALMGLPAPARGMAAP